MTCRIGFLAVFLLAPLLYASDPKQIIVDLDITNPEPRMHGDNLELELSVISQKELAVAEIRFELDGIVLEDSAQVFRIGPLPPGVTIRRYFPIRMTSLGTAKIRCTVSNMNEGGEVLNFEEGHLFFLNSIGEVLLDNRGFVYIQNQDVERRRDSLGLNQDQVQKELDKIRGFIAPFRPSNAITAYPHQARDQEQFNNHFQDDGTADAGPDTITVNGRVLWEDTGGAEHPGRFITVEIWEEDPLFDDLLDTVVTSVDGTFSATVHIGSKESEIFVRAVSKSPGILDVSCQDGSCDTYFMQTPTQTEVNAGDTVDFGDIVARDYASNTPARAFPIADALIESWLYADTLPGLTIPLLNVKYPHTGNSYGANLNVKTESYHNWDTLHHEYGHYVMDLANFENNPGGSHSIQENLSVTHGKDHGNRLAWGEAWPTYFGTSLQQIRNSSVLGVPTVGDLRYSSINANGSVKFYYSLESRSIRNWSCSGSQYSCLGEDNEYADQMVLWDFYDSNNDGEDRVSRGHLDIWNTLRTNGPEIMSEAIAALTSGMDAEQKVAYGSILMEHGISPKPTAPNDGASLAPGSLFEWEPQNGVDPAYQNNEFALHLYSDDFATLVLEVNNLTDPNYTLTNADFTNLILSGFTDFKWVVLGENTISPTTGPYYSAAKTVTLKSDLVFVIDDTGSMAEEISGVRNALTAFITALASSPDPPPTTTVITFKDSVSHRITSKVLTEIQSVVNSLFAYGGGACPEASIEALNAAEPLLKAGGRILLATDASPYAGSDRAATIAALRAKGIRVDVLLSADCEATTFISSNREDTAEVSVASNDSAVVSFSEIATATSGTFSFQPGVNSGAPTLFENVSTSMMLGIVEPRIITMEPSIINQGSSLALSIFGSNTNFNSSSDVSFSNPDVVVNSMTVLSATEILANVSVASDASMGYGDIVITTNVGSETETALGEGVMNVDEEISYPAILGATPSRLGVDTTVDILITGYATSFDATSNPIVGSGIIVNSVFPLSSEELLVNMTIEPTASLGYRNLAVSTGAEYAYETGIGPLLIVSEAASSIPRVVEVTPNQLLLGETATINIIGADTHFAQPALTTGTNISFSGGNINVDSINVLSETEVEATVTVGTNATPGFRDLFVETDGETATFLNGLELLACTPVTFTSQPSEIEICPDEEVTLSVSAAGNGHLSYQWFKNGSPISGATNADYIIPSTTPFDTGIYSCQVTSTCTGASSEPARLLVHDYVTVTSIPSSSLAQGLNPITLEATMVCSSGVYDLEWTELATGHSFGVNVNPILLDPPPAATTTYQVLATEAAGEDDHQIMVLVPGNPLYIDYNGDGCNTLEDLWLLGESWTVPASNDANGDGVINVLDMIYINTQQPIPCP